ncbi:MAG: NYN domain-containing protein [Syntrophales bacterium]|nr:NYN domain-containing protein [Syntrophales bacterium]
MHIIIDGYNMIRQSPLLRHHERLGLEEGRNALLRFLHQWLAESRHRITVVFDGWKEGSPSLEHDRRWGIDIYYSPRGITADEVIKEMALKSGEEVIVVTSDREVAVFLERRGKTTVPSTEFESYLMERGEKNRNELEEEEETKRKNKKGPARRLSRKERLARLRLAKL